MAYLTILLLMGSWLISNCLLLQSVWQCCIIYTCGVVSTGKYLEAGLLGQMAHESVILIEIAKFPSVGVVTFCNPKTSYEKSRFPITLLSNVTDYVT